MSEKYYLYTDDTQQGPFSIAELRARESAGEIPPSSLVWKEGMPAWKPSHEILSALTPVARSPAIVTARYERTSSGANSHSPESIRRFHLDHEREIRLVGVLCAILAAPWFGAVFPFLAAAMRNSDPLLWLYSPAFCGIGVLFLWAGIQLATIAPNARIPGGIASGFALLLFPCGTVIGGYILYLLFGKKGNMIFSDSYRLICAKTPEISAKVSKPLTITFGAVIIIPTVVLVAVFLF